MATLTSKPLGESVDITFDFDNALPVIVRFSLDVSYYQSTVNANLTEPNVSFDGVSFTPVINNLFDVPAGKKYFIIRARLNNDPFTRVDDSVQVTVVPVTNTHLITNPDDFTAIVELKTVTYKPSISVDAATATVGEGSTAQAVFSFSSGLIFESVFDFKLVFTGTATAADIAALTYKLNGGNAKPLAMSDQITAPVGTSNITINFPVVQDEFNDGVEGAIVSLMEPIYQLHTTTKIPVTKTFTFLDTYVPPNGTLLRYFCTGKDQYAEYADGFGGVYNTLIKKNSVDCGYVIPAAGTLLSQHCAGYDKIGEYADGSDGSYFSIIALEDASCGYVPDAPNPQTELIPTKYDANNKGTTVTLSNGDRNFAGLLRDMSRTVFSAMYGKWYIEHTVLLPTDKQEPTSIGVVTANHPIGNWIGSNINSWAWWPHEGTKFHNDVQGFFGPSLIDGDVVGILLDIQNGSIAFQLNGVDIGEMYNSFPAYTKLYFATSALNSSFARTNFGQTVFKYPVPSGYYPGFGEPANAPPPRRTFLNNFCSGVDRWVTMADGKGGSFTEIELKNDPGCGYIPPPDPAGTVVRTYCVGVDKYTEYNDGNYGVYSTLTEARNLACGYKPAGALISTYCDGYTKIGTYSDGEFGTYIDTIETFSRDCGYNAGSGGSNSETTIDPNLVITADGMILFDTLNSQITGDLVLDVENTRPLPPTYPIADTVLSYSCLGASKILELANGSGGSYNKAVSWHPDCGAKPYFYDGIPAGYTTIVDGSTLNVSSNLLNLSMDYTSSVYNSCFIPGAQPSKTSAKIELDISYAQYGAASAPAIGFCLITSNNVYQFGLLYAVNSLQYASSGSNGSVAINSVILSGTALSAGALPASGRQLFSLIVEPVSGFLKITMLINGTSVHVFNSNIAATSFTPGIYLRSSAGELFDFRYTDYP